MTEQRSLKQEYNGQTLEHVIVHDESGRVLPTVILIPTVMGVQPLEIGFAEKLVERGYHAVVVDLFGRRFTPGADKEAAFAAMGELRSDRAALRDRLLAVVDEVRKREHVDASRLAVIGFCFGGQCALDVARAGADVGLGDAVIAAQDERDRAGLEDRRDGRLDRLVAAPGIGGQHGCIAEVHDPEHLEGVDLRLQVRPGRAARGPDPARPEPGSRAIRDEVVGGRADDRHIRALQLRRILCVGRAREAE